VVVVLVLVLRFLARQFQSLFHRLALCIPAGFRTYQLQLYYPPTS
jgi:hypothetical protein